MTVPKYWRSSHLIQSSDEAIPLSGCNNSLKPGGWGGVLPVRTIRLYARERVTAPYPASSHHSNCNKMSRLASLPERQFSHNRRNFTSPKSVTVPSRVDEPLSVCGWFEPEPSTSRVKHEGQPKFSLLVTLHTDGTPGRVNAQVKHGPTRLAAERPCSRAAERPPFPKHKRRYSQRARVSP